VDILICKVVVIKIYWTGAIHLSIS